MVVIVDVSEENADQQEWGIEIWRRNVKRPDFLQYTHEQLGAKRSKRSRPRVHKKNGVRYYIVKEIIGKRADPKRAGKVEYHVLWKGYNRSYASWEPEENLGEAMDIVREFEASIQASGNDNIGNVDVEENHHQGSQLQITWAKGPPTAQQQQHLVQQEEDGAVESDELHILAVVAQQSSPMCLPLTPAKVNRKRAFFEDSDPEEELNREWTEQAPDSPRISLPSLPGVTAFHEEEMDWHNEEQPNTEEEQEPAMEDGQPRVWNELEHTDDLDKFVAHLIMEPGDGIDQAIELIKVNAPNFPVKHPVVHVQMLLTKFAGLCLRRDEKVDDHRLTTEVIEFGKKLTEIVHTMETLLAPLEWKGLCDEVEATLKMVWRDKNAMQLGNALLDATKKAALADRVIQANVLH